MKNKKVLSLSATILILKAIENALKWRMESRCELENHSKVYLNKRKRA